LLDEPTNGLDPMQREQMLALIRRVGETLGHDVVLSSHLLDEVKRVSDAVVILDAGRTVASGDLSELSAASEEVHVELSGANAAADAARLSAALTDAGLDARADGRVVITTLAADANFDVLRDLLASLSLTPRRVQRRRASLEDVFFAGTGGSA
ncbi:MAG: ABC transporter ATP-binding protein, partial [Acidimicrobiia bacterium]